LLGSKAAIHLFELDFVTITVLVTIFVGGVIFIIAIILAGTLAGTLSEITKVKKSHQS
jgi:hypothetical protein